MRIMLIVVSSALLVLFVLWLAIRVRWLVRSYLAKRRLDAAVRFSEAQLQLIALRAMAQLLNEARKSLVHRQP
jgi:hypothetical protein